MRLPAIRLEFSLLLLGLLTGATAPGHAQTFRVTCTFSGQITSCSDPSLLGQTYSATFTYDYRLAPVGPNGDFIFSTSTTRFHALTYQLPNQGRVDYMPRQRYEIIQTNNPDTSGTPTGKFELVADMQNSNQVHVEFPRPSGQTIANLNQLQNIFSSSPFSLSGCVINVTSPSGSPAVTFSGNVTSMSSSLSVAPLHAQTFRVTCTFCGQITSCSDPSLLGQTYWATFAYYYRLAPVGPCDPGCDFKFSTSPRFHDLCYQLPNQDPVKYMPDQRYEIIQTNTPDTSGRPTGKFELFAFMQNTNQVHVEFPYPSGQTIANLNQLQNIFFSPPFSLSGCVINVTSPSGSPVFSGNVTSMSSSLSFGDEVEFPHPSGQSTYSPATAQAPDLYAAVSSVPCPAVFVPASPCYYQAVWQPRYVRCFGGLFASRGRGGCGR